MSPSMQHQPPSAFDLSGPEETPVDVLSAELDPVHISTSRQPTPPTPSLSQVTVSPLTGLPTNPTRLPFVSLHIPAAALPQELESGIKELAKHAVRGNISVGEGDGSRDGDGWRSVKGARDGEWVWNVSFESSDGLRPGHLEMEPSASSFYDEGGGSPEERANAEARPYIVLIKYKRKNDAFRALGHLLSLTRTLLSPWDPSMDPSPHPSLLSPPQPGNPPTRFLLSTCPSPSYLPYSETCVFDTLGTMIDCSRNGVLKVESVKFLCRMLANMGYDMLQLYTEDTYKIEDEPFFGYLRGGYTNEELQEIDDYAFDLGIEVIPCIQTLGHLGQMLQWPRFLGLRDTPEVLLAEVPETYAFLEKMIGAATAPFRTNKIHLGMDETHGLGYGRYQSVFAHQPWKDPTKIFVEHLQRVNEICKRLGLKPMIWSDMLFCLNAKNNTLLGYYESGSAATQEVIEGIPDDVDLVYWDYYHTTKESYAKRISDHWELGRKSPWMAAGSWTWSRFWTALPFTFATNRACMNASKAPESGVKHAFLTIWGDEGNEVDLYSSLPAWLYWADHAYTPNDEVDVPLLKAKFDGICGGSFDDFVYASKLDDVNPEMQPLDNKIHFASNLSKWLLWEEPFYGFVSPTMRRLNLEAHFASISSYISHALTFSPTSLNPAHLPPRSLCDYPLNARLRFPYLLATALEIKARLRDRLSDAYNSGDWGALKELGGRGQTSALGRLVDTVERIWRYHRQMWMSMYKPFGWESLELRYGGLRARLDTMHNRIARFLDYIDEMGGDVPPPSLRRAHRQQAGDPSASRIDVDVDDAQASPDGKAAGTGAVPAESVKTPDVFLDVRGAATNEVYEGKVTSVPELEEELQVAYGSTEQLLDYVRVSRPQYY